MNQISAENREKNSFRRQSLPTPENDMFNSDDGVYVLAEAALPNSGYWIWCQPHSQHKQSSSQTGWKLYISATTRDMQEALAALAIDHKLAEFKFSPAAMLQKDQSPEAGSSKGKTAVFYHTENGIDGKPINWETFIREASAIVTAFGGPGQTVERSRHIPGSSGIYYSTDSRSLGGGYIDAEMRKTYGLGRGDDPFLHINLQTTKNENGFTTQEDARRANNPQGVRLQ
jgi:hypothetical protein